MPSGSDLNVRSIQWGLWANETTLLGSYLVLIGGITGIIGGVIPFTEPFTFWLPIGIYGVIVGLLIAILEYPRGKKPKGNTMQRSNQECFGTLVSVLPLMSSYYFRACIYFILAIPAGLVVPTFLGAVCVIIGSATYLGGACHKESWTKIPPWTPAKKAGNDFAQPPTQPPPRLPQQQI